MKIGECYLGCIHGYSPVLADGQVTYLYQSSARKQKYLMDYILKYQSSHFSLNQLHRNVFSERLLIFIIIIIEIVTNFIIAIILIIIIIEMLTIFIIVIVIIVIILTFVIIIITIIIIVIVIIITWLFSEPYSFFFQLSFCKKSMEVDRSSFRSFKCLSKDEKRTQQKPQHQLCETLNWHFHTR